MSEFGKHGCIACASISAGDKRPLCTHNGVGPYCPKKRMEP